MKYFEKLSLQLLKRSSWLSAHKKDNTKPEAQVLGPLSRGMTHVTPSWEKWEGWLYCDHSTAPSLSLGGPCRIFLSVNKQHCALHSPTVRELEPQAIPLWRGGGGRGNWSTHQSPVLGKKATPFLAKAVHILVRSLCQGPWKWWWQKEIWRHSLKSEVAHQVHKERTVKSLRAEEGKEKVPEDDRTCSTEQLQAERGTLQGAAGWVLWTPVCDSVVLALSLGNHTTTAVVNKSQVFKSLSYAITNLISIRRGYGQLTQGIGTKKYICEVHLRHLGQRLNVVSCL